MYIKVHTIPDSKKESVFKEKDRLYRIHVKEPAERNLANKRVREILCQKFGLEKGGVRLVSGHRSPIKVFDVILEE